jgi:D-alanyl-D-alanine carboxypeptidase
MSAGPSAGSAPHSTYLDRIDRLHRELGIAEDYARSRSLTLFFEAAALAVADRDPDGAELLLSAEDAEPWRAMKDCARNEGVVLLPYSGFRSVERQVQIIRSKLDRGQSLESILRYVAAPGYSEHHTGRAIDIGTLFEPPLEERFAQTTAYRWLTQRAADFGFALSYPRGNVHGIGYEPWHWCWKS